MIINGAISDDLLVNLLREGDSKAFAMIYERYVPELFRFLTKNIKDKSDCEEIVQDVFVSLWERREALEVDSLRAYLFTSVKYKVIRYIKHQMVKRKYEEHFRNFEATYVAPIEPEKSTPIVPLHALLSESLQGLPDRCREAFQLRLEQNLTNSEIAQRMHISKRTVEDYMSTAFEHLRKFRKDILNTE
ncbi:MAG: RNA polymerase sigma-70 factor [Cyclobacteriaceae bacterium]|nr:RNA polymerase sigma-70 factor [Cyclobacteriaceae bacterium]